MASKTRKSLNSKNKIICKQCKTQVLESDESLQCDVCEKTLHALCSKLDKKQYDMLIKNPSLEYKCMFCAPSENVCANDIAEIKTKLNQLDEIKETMQFMASQYDSILKGVKKNDKQIKALKKRNVTLREEVKSLKSTVNFSNNMRVQKYCIINGIKADDERLAMDVLMDVSKQIGADICKDEVEEAYFLNRNKSNSNNKQNEKKSMVVKFANMKTKQLFMKEKSKKKQMDNLKMVYVNDFLCKESLELFNHAKALKEVGFKFVYIKGGNVYAKKDEKSR